MKVDVRGTGRPLIYLHPAGGIRWTRVLDELSKSFTLHLPTFPGFDGTPTEAALKSRRDLALRVGEYIAKTIQGPADVVGCSFGGAVALWLAIERSELVDHLVLEYPAGLQTIDPAPRADPAAFRQALYKYPEKMTFEKKPDDVEAANRAMMAHYGATDGKDPQLPGEDPGKQRGLALHALHEHLQTGERLPPRRGGEAAGHAPGDEKRDRGEQDEEEQVVLAARERLRDAYCGNATSEVRGRARSSPRRRTPPDLAPLRGAARDRP